MPVAAIVRHLTEIYVCDGDGRSSLPQPAIERLVSTLRYQYMQYLHGAAAYDQVTGQRHRVAVTTRYLCRMEGTRLVTSFGMLSKVWRLLEQSGFEVLYTEIPVQRPRPDCYTYDLPLLQQYVQQWRATQWECVTAIAQSPGGIIEAAAGYGKTFLFRALCLLFSRAKIDIVVKPTDVQRRIIADLTTCMPMVGKIGDGAHRVGRVTVVTADSLHKVNGDADIVLVDEVHQAVSDRISSLLASRYRIARMFGFSATPYDRADGLSAKLEFLFGPRIFHLPYQEAVRHGLVVPMHVRWLPIVLPVNPAAGKEGVPRMRWGIWRNGARNEAIAADARRYPAEHSVLIMCATLDHAVNLQQHLPDFTLCYAGAEEERIQRFIAHRMLPEGYRPPDRQARIRMSQQFSSGELRKVIATDVWSTGVSFDHLQTLYRADARESTILDTQIPARASRIFEGKNSSEIVDCADFFDRSLLGKSKVRRRHYRALGWTEEWPQGLGANS